MTRFPHFQEKVSVASRKPDEYLTKNVSFVKEMVDLAADMP